MAIRVVTLCAGYDSQALALDRLKRDNSGFDYELVAWAEFDPDSKQPIERQSAVIAHNALFPEWSDRNLGDITNADWGSIYGDIDLLCYSTPCQSISVAGLQEGFQEGSGTRSSVIWSVLDAVRTLRPKYLLMENVSAMVSKKFVKDFQSWQTAISSLGYDNYTKILNAKDYGVAQNRPRVFMVSIRRDLGLTYHFPRAFTLERRLKDYLEPVVDARYYLSEKFIKGCIAHSDRKQSEGCGFKLEPTDGNCVAKAIGTQAGCRQTDNYIIEPRVIQVGNIWPDTEKFKNRTMGRVYDTAGISPTINCCGGGDREPKIIEYKTISNNDTTNTFEEVNETNTREILQILREEVGTETYKWAIGRFISIFKAEILQQRMYEESICEDGATSSRIQPCSSHLAQNSLFDTGEKNAVRDVQCDRKYRCTSQGFQLSEQFTREFNDIVSQLPYETTPTKESVSYLWSTSQGLQSMQQTLLAMEEIWRPTTRTLEHIQSQKYRIRKLTCREVFRLMDLDDADIDKIQSTGISNSQQYKLAGNSIVISCLYHIFRKLFVETGNEKEQMTLF